MSPDMHGAQLYRMVIPIAVVLLILVLRNNRPRKLRIELLWVRPLIWTLILLAALTYQPPPMTLVSVALMAAGLALGCALGWQRGRFQKITVDPETHAITSRASVVGMIFILALVLVRYGLRDVMAQNAAALHLPVSAALDALIILAAGMMVTQSLEMWTRARRLLEEARAAKAGALTSGGNPPLVR
jgi:hypothetical protein